MLTTPEIIDDPEGKWIAQCPKCEQDTDLESIGWVRRGAYSYGKRTSIHCPHCRERSSCRIVHVDRNGQPDQPFSYVLSKVLEMQTRVWMWVLSSAAVAYAIFRMMRGIIH